ncbi:hypothetical protein E4T56_gene10810, partial [Termitomyces sp. T112]
MPSTLKRLLRRLIRRKREIQPVQDVLGQVYDSQYRSSISDLIELDAVSREPAMMPIEAPIYQLPAEVLGLVFIYTLDPLCDRRQYPPEVNEPPIVLCGVCRQWRDVAISMPMLWSAFNA